MSDSPTMECHTPTDIDLDLEKDFLPVTEVTSEGSPPDKDSDKGTENGEQEASAKPDDSVHPTGKDTTIADEDIDGSAPDGKTENSVEKDKPSCEIGDGKKVYEADPKTTATETLPSRSIMKPSSLNMNLEVVLKPIGLTTSATAASSCLPRPRSRIQALHREYCSPKQHLEFCPPCWYVKSAHTDLQAYRKLFPLLPVHRHKLATSLVGQANSSLLSIRREEDLSASGMSTGLLPPRGLANGFGTRTRDTGFSWKPSLGWSGGVWGYHVARGGTGSTLFSDGMGLPGMPPRTVHGFDENGCHRLLVSPVTPILRHRTTLMKEKVPLGAHLSKTVSFGTAVQCSGVQGL